MENSQGDIGMLFNSYIFIFLFLPCTVMGYFIVNKHFSYRIGKLFLIIMSLVFYASAGYECLLILVGNCLINYILLDLIKKRNKYKKSILFIGVAFNILLLFYFKYYNFFVTSLNVIIENDFTLKNIILPLGISFFVFQQISYLVDLYKGEIENVKFEDYIAYILFFPKLLMGPLISPKELITQFNDEDRKNICWENTVIGLQLFGVGLFKKVVIADTFSKAVAWGFSDIAGTTSADIWIVMLSYTFQIYFDFSGYSDMAIGVAKMLNIDLPINFDSPYMAMSIRDFWKRWHMSLTKFFTEYIYIPLGGNRKGSIRTCINTIFVFAVSGIWHGANWTFILWGILHGIANVMDRFSSNVWKKKHPVIRWMGTFFIINVLWLLFRANSVSEWIMLLKHMFTFSNMSISQDLLKCFVLPESDFIFRVLNINELSKKITGFSMLIFLLGALSLCLGMDNNYRRNKKINVITMFSTVILMTWGILYLSLESTFVYWNF